MGEKPTAAEEESARHDASMSAIGNVRGREASSGGTGAAPGDPIPDIGLARTPGDPVPDIDVQAAERSAGAPLKGVDVKLG
jgi:hypothetical protein